MVLIDLTVSQFAALSVHWQECVMIVDSYVAARVLPVHCKLRLLQLRITLGN